VADVDDLLDPPDPFDLVDLVSLLDSFDPVGVDEEELDAGESTFAVSLPAAVVDESEGFGPEPPDARESVR
jgi:hypothetical protein